MPFPLPTPQGAGIGNSGTSPRPIFEGCARQPSGQEATSANLFRRECQGCNEARKPSCPALQFNLPRRLSPPSHGSADRRLRPVRVYCIYLISFNLLCQEVSPVASKPDGLPIQGKQGPVDSPQRQEGHPKKDTPSARASTQRKAPRVACYALE